MRKYDMLPRLLRQKGLAGDDNFFEPQPLDEATALLTHTPEYWQHLTQLTLPPAAVRRTGFPLSEQLVLRERIITQGTVDCALHALQYGAAFNIAGGTHHAFAGSGDAYCLLNDCAVAANYLLHTGRARHILIIDLDAHQGQGTAHIFKNSEQVFTFSMHSSDNYPLKKEESNLDIALPLHCSGTQYLQLLEEALYKLKHLPADLVFYIAGVDVLATDALGRLGLSMADCRQRDRMVYTFCRSCQLPVVTTMGGGYSKDINTIVEAHCGTFEEAISIYSKLPTS